MRNGSKGPFPAPLSISPICLLVCLPVFLLAASLSIAQNSRPEPNLQLASPEINARVESLLKKMTLEEKVGRLVQYSAGFATGPASSKVSYDELTRRGEIGSMLNVI